MSTMTGVDTPPSADPDPMLQAIARLAPGTGLREGLERILHGRTGGLIVIGMDDAIASMCSGGFELDVEFTATRLRELAKMDGAVVLDDAAGRILRANVQLLPDPTIDTTETGTRHRTADRVSKQTGFPVISVSESMGTIALYFHGRRHVLEDPSTILSRANQALQTLERYRARLDEVSGTLTALEIEDLVTVRDVCSVVQRLEMVERIAQEIHGYIVELGSDGRLLSLQLDELVHGVEADRRNVVEDYLRPEAQEEDALQELDVLGSAELLDLVRVAQTLGFRHAPDLLDEAVSPHGYRLLSKVPRVSPGIVRRVVERFTTLQGILVAGVEELTQIEGVSTVQARAIREGLSRLAESSVLERYV